MASQPEPTQGLGVFCVINGDDARCRPEDVRKYFLAEVGGCRIVSSARSHNSDKTFVTLEFSSRQNAQYAMSKSGCKVNGCRIGASPFRSRRLGNLIGQNFRGGAGFGNPRFQHFRGNGGYRGGMPNRGRGNFQSYPRQRNYGDQMAEKVRGMSPQTAARFIENRIRQKEERTHQRSTKSYSRSRSRSRSQSPSQSRSRSPYRRGYSRHSSDYSRSPSSSRSPRRKSRKSRSSSRSSVDSYKKSHRNRSASPADSGSDEEHRAKERRRRHKKRKRRHRSSSSDHHEDSDGQNADNGDVVQEVDDWRAQHTTHSDVGDAEAVGGAEAVAPTEDAVAQEVAVDEQGDLPPLPTFQLDLPIPSTLPLALQQSALEKRHAMQQEFEADVGTISSVAEMLRRHDESIGVQLRGALYSVVDEVTAKYAAEFDEFLGSSQASGQ